MNYKYQKQPVTVEAFQMTEERRHDNKDWPDWLNQAWNKEPGEEGCLFCVEGGDQLRIQTLEGEQLVSWGDYIIQGVEGEIYPCKEGIFLKTYVPLMDEPNS